MGVAISLSELLGDEVRRNPYPFYARLHQLDRPAAPLGPSDRHAAVVFGHEMVDRVLRDPNFRVLDSAYLDRGGTKWRDHPVVRVMQDSMFNANDADHSRVRRHFTQALTVRRVTALEPAIIRIMDGLLDQLAKAGADGAPVDFMSAFALPLPSDVIGELLGVPESDRAWFPTQVRAFDAILEIGQRSYRQVVTADAAAVELTRYFAEMCASRRAQPRDDLVSALVQTQATSPDLLTETELLANLIVMFNAGFRTTANMFGNGLVLLMRHPEALAALRADPSLAPAYIEEILRYDPPVHFAIRFAAQDTEIAGIPIQSGQSVVALTAAANRDPSRFVNPDSFDPFRTDTHHFAFSAGPHFCLGAALGRVEGRLALPRLLDRFPTLALAAEPGERRAFMLRGYDELLVHLT